MINLKSILCECGCQNGLKEIPINPMLKDTLQYLDKHFDFKSNTIISGYRCKNRILHLLDLWKKDPKRYNKPAENGFHTKLPIQAVDIVHPKLKEIFLLLDNNHKDDYGLGYYFGGIPSLHIDSRELRTRWVHVNRQYLYQHSSPQYDIYYQKIKLIA